MLTDKNISNPFQIKPFIPALCISLLLPATEALADGTVECNVGTGTDSTECGVNASATFTNSTAVGHTANALSNETTAVGRNASASGAQAIAIGSSVFASSENTTAMGYQSHASGTRATATGSFARANSFSSVSLGYTAGYNNNFPVTDSPHAIAIGSYSNITAESGGAIAIGGDLDEDNTGAEATAIGSIAIGPDAVATGPLQNLGNSIAIGNSAFATTGSVSIGKASNTNSFFGGISIGKDTMNLSNNGIILGRAGNIDDSSERSIVIGDAVKAENAPQGIALGFEAQTLAAGAIAIGSDVANDVADSILANVPFRIETDKAPGISPILTIENTNAAVGVRNVIKLKNNGGVGFELEDTNLGNAWDFRTAGNGGFLVSNIGVPGSKIQVNLDGSVFLNSGGFSLNGTSNNVIVGGTHTAIQHIASSSRAVKKDFTKINAVDVMSKIKDLEVTEWRYKDKAAQGRHIGPMAEDFYKLFKLGADDKHVSATDMASIALIAAKELQKKSDTVNAETKALRAENASLKQRLASLEKLVTNLASSQGILTEKGDTVVLK